jgi:hypothetical protein
MSHALASSPPSLDPATIERVLLHGDLRQLTPAQKVAYYGTVCDSLGLNPLTQPFAYIVLNGKEVLYAKREATEQLRFNRQISIEIKAREVIEGCYVVTASATMSNGRKDESTGVVPIEHIKGEARANALMKAETKAKRRVTLSICGLGILDESEIESTQPFVVEVPKELSPVKQPQNSTAPNAQTPAPVTGDTISAAQQKRLWAIARSRQWRESEVKEWLADLWNYNSTAAIKREHYDQIVEQLGADRESAGQHES